VTAAQPLHLDQHTRELLNACNPLVCWYCGRRFAARTDARYCRNACRQAAFKRRRRRGQTPNA